MELDKITVTIKEIDKEVVKEAGFKKNTITITKVELAKEETSLLSRYLLSLPKGKSLGGCLGVDCFDFFYNKQHTPKLFSKKILASEFHPYENRTGGKVEYYLTDLGYRILKNLRKRKII